MLALARAERSQRLDPNSSLRSSSASASSSLKLKGKGKGKEEEGRESRAREKKRPLLEGEGEKRSTLRVSRHDFTWVSRQHHQLKTRA